MAWEQRKEAERDIRFVELGGYLCEVRAGQDWRLLACQLPTKVRKRQEFRSRIYP